MKNLSIKSYIYQSISTTPIKLNRGLLENICMDVNPRINCQKIYSNFLQKLNTMRQSNEVKQDSDALAYPSIEEVWSNISLEGNNSHNHVSLKTSDIHQSLKGSFLVSSDGWRSPFKKVESIEASDISTIAMGGIDFDTPEYFGALRKNLFQFYSNIKGEKVTSNVDRVFFHFPLYTKEKRYNEILNFHTIPNYTSQEMTQLALEYVIPKIEHRQPLSFFCFSASCRELMMIENACKQYLKAKNFNEAKIKEMMSYVNAVLIEYAFDWSVTSEEYGFGKLILLSTEDFGIVRSKFNRELIYGASSLASGINLIQKSENSLDKALIFGTGMVPIQIADKINWKGHSLTHYVHSFAQLLLDKNKQEVIGSYSPKC